MRFSKLFLGIFFALIWESQCFGHGSIACGYVANSQAVVACAASTEDDSTDQAISNALGQCRNKNNVLCRMVAFFSNGCVTVLVPTITNPLVDIDGPKQLAAELGDSPELSSARARASCSANWNTPCRQEIIACDRPSLKPAPTVVAPAPLPSAPQPQPTPQLQSPKQKLAQIQSRPPAQANSNATFSGFYCHVSDAACVRINRSTAADADRDIRAHCQKNHGGDCLTQVSDSGCYAVHRSSDGRLWTSFGNTVEQATEQSLSFCKRQAGGQGCEKRETFCAGDPTYEFLSDPTFWRALQLAKLYENVISGIGLGLGILIVLLAYAKRAAISNFLIHGNLPYTIENRSDDIEVLFTRSQRLNWTGRVVFGLTTQLGMTEQQLLLVRRYRLGRVIAFDSLRRQKQNELALLHLQLAAKAESKPKGEHPLSQMLAALRTLFWIFFWYIRALFSFLFGFLFLRVTIAKLVRGGLIESIELKLLMEAKDAIEQTAIYLKEYLLLAETFDGREEVYEPPA